MQFISCDPDLCPADAAVDCLALAHKLFVFVMTGQTSIDVVPAPARDEFVIPTYSDIGANVPERIAKRSRSLIEEELHIWGTRAVEGHFDHPHGREWMNIADTVTPLLAELVGAKEKEVACMGTLTANLHLMMSVFYKPTSTRYKILCEGKAFPSDQYAFASQARFHGYDPKDAIIELFPREGEFTIRDSDIVGTIAEQGSTIALVIFSGVQYYTVWCSYKYLNSGPGGIGGLFVHEKWESTKTPQFTGWWGHDPTTRFDMPPNFTAIRGAQGFQQSNPSVLSTVSLLGSLQVFKQVGMMGPLRERSISLTAHLEVLLRQTGFYINPGEAAKYSPADPPRFTIITPEEHESRGAQLSLLFLPEESGTMDKVHEYLKLVGVIGDERKPDVIRLTPAPLYNTARDCEYAAESIKKAFEAITTAN
ncbi:hypothetical protein ID866_3888 [Astraeus odoratus]|nr:hypothetical protein ID866_3888 [Astraeus odoratus]